MKDENNEYKPINIHHFHDTSQLKFRILNAVVICCEARLAYSFAEPGLRDFKLVLRDGRVSW